MKIPAINTGDVISYKQINDLHDGVKTFIKYYYLNKAFEREFYIRLLDVYI